MYTSQSRWSGIRFLRTFTITCIFGVLGWSMETLTLLADISKKIFRDELSFSVCIPGVFPNVSGDGTFDFSNKIRWPIWITTRSRNYNQIAKISFLIPVYSRENLVTFHTSRNRLVIQVLLHWKNGFDIELSRIQGFVYAVGYSSTLFSWRFKLVVDKVNVVWTSSTCLATRHICLL